MTAVSRHYFHENFVSSAYCQAIEGQYRGLRIPRPRRWTDMPPTGQDNEAYRRVADNSFPWKASLSASHSSSTLAQTGHNHFPLGKVMDILLASLGRSGSRKARCRLQIGSFLSEITASAHSIHLPVNVVNVIPCNALSREFTH